MAAEVHCAVHQLSQKREAPQSNPCCTATALMLTGSIKALLAAMAATGVTTDQVLLQHLRARKFYAAKAYKSICLRAAFLHEHPDLASSIKGVQAAVSAQFGRIDRESWPHQPSVAASATCC